MSNDKSGEELDLAPCPFCGESNCCIFLRRKDAHRTCDEIQCENCGAIGPVWSAVDLDGEERDAEIVRAWNYRTDHLKGEGDG